MAHQRRSKHYSAHRVRKARPQNAWVLFENTKGPCRVYNPHRVFLQVPAEKQGTCPSRITVNPVLRHKKTLHRLSTLPVHPAISVRKPRAAAALAGSCRCEVKHEKEYQGTPVGPCPVSSKVKVNASNHISGRRCRGYRVS